MTIKELQELLKEITKQQIHFNTTISDVETRKTYLLGLLEKMKRDNPNDGITYSMQGDSKIAQVVVILNGSPRMIMIPIGDIEGMTSEQQLDMVNTTLTKEQREELYK